jgi:protein SCO1/2
MNNKKTGIFLLVFFMLLGVAFLGYYFKVNNGVKKSALPIVQGDRNHHVSPFSFTNQDGKTITNEDVKGKIYVAGYFFATCKTMCPKMNANLNNVYKAFKGNKNVLILLHTVDPKNDTPAALKEYALRFDADADQWMFLTGNKQQLYDMARYSYLISAEDDTVGVKIEDQFIHDKHYSLVDGFGRIRGFYDGLQPSDMDRLIADIKTLQKEEAPQ